MTERGNRRIVQVSVAFAAATATAAVALRYPAPPGMARDEHSQARDEKPWIWADGSTMGKAETATAAASLFLAVSRSG